MTEQYWQRYRQQISMDPMHMDDPFWRGIRTDIQRMNAPKHHLELYSMCKSDNPYIRQIKNSPNITVQTVAQLICRDKACQLQYCLSLMKIATENRRNKIDLKGCKQQYDTMWSCIKTQRTRVINKQNELRDRVKGIKAQVKEDISIKIKDKNKQQKPIYI